MPQLRHFWNDLRTELADKRPYKASIGSMRLRLQELRKSDSKAQELSQQKADGYEEINDILHHQRLPFVLKAMQTELISRHYNDPLAGHFGIGKTCKSLAQKYYWPTLCHDVKTYVKSCDVYLATKAVRHKLTVIFNRCPYQRTDGKTF